MLNHLIPIPEGLGTGYFMMGKNILKDVPELLKTAFPGKTPWLIADDNTWQAAGAAVAAALTRAGMACMEPKIFPGRPKLHPDYAISLELAESLNGSIIPVAVGSGVLNDLVKCAAGKAGLPYCCVATAASVDGYTSCGGAMSVEGRKLTVQAKPPYALAADIDVLEHAPAAMLASGYADLLTKLPAGADWMAAESLGIEPIRKDVWDIVQKDLRSWLANGHDLNGIFMGLAATGYAMQIYIDSRPASGAEHMMSHVWEMEGLLNPEGENPSHGFQVGIGTLVMAQIMEFIENTPVAEARRMAVPLQTLAERKQTIAELLKRGCYGTGIEDVALGKFLTGKAAEDRRELIFTKWEEIGKRIKGQLPPLGVLKKMLADAGAPTDYRAIGLSREQYLHGIRTAQIFRKRYTTLDMLYEAGLLEQAISVLE